MITKEEVLKVLNYDEFTGVFRWKTTPRIGVKAGSEAGCVFVTGGKPYRKITISGREYRAHRLAWLVLNGRFPEYEIDHINGDGLDNRSENLRAVNHAENAKNVRKRADNTSGVVGVCWDKNSAQWMAQIWLNGKRNYLGIFDDFEMAVAVRKAAEKKLGYHKNHGMERSL